MNQSSPITTNKPADTVRIGTVRSAIWRNVSDDGQVRYNATIDRGYRDANGEWQTTHSFGRDDLLVLAKIADQSHTRICELQDQDREAATNAASNGTKSR